MSYYKQISGDYIIAIGQADTLPAGGIEIVEQEYNTIMRIIDSRPESELGMKYRLKTDYTWDLAASPELDNSMALTALPEL